MPVAATEVGVMLPSVREIAGVVVGLVTVPDTPLAVVTDTEVTVPPLPVATSVLPLKARPEPSAISLGAAALPELLPSNVGFVDFDYSSN